MSDDKKQTEASKIELQEDDLDQIHGGASGAKTKKFKIDIDGHRPTSTSLKKKAT